MIRSVLAAAVLAFALAPQVGPRSDLRPLASPLPAPYTARQWRRACLVTAAVAVAGGLALASRLRVRIRLPPAHPRREAHVDVDALLREIEPIGAETDVMALYDRISEIARAGLSAALVTSAASLPTTELVAELRARRFPSLVIDDTAALFQHVDRVRFGGWRPAGATAHEAAVARVRRIIAVLRAGTTK